MGDEDEGSLEDAMKQDMKDKFAQLDANGDGALSKDELKDLLVSLGGALSGADWEQLFNEMDKDKSGTVDVNEFINYLFEPDRFTLLDERLTLAKAAFDESADEEGLIEKSALLQVCSKFCVQLGVPLAMLSDEEIEEMWDGMWSDDHVERKYSYDEFTKIAYILLKIGDEAFTSGPKCPHCDIGVDEDPHIKLPRYDEIPACWGCGQTETHGHMHAGR